MTQGGAGLVPGDDEEDSDEVRAMLGELPLGASRLDPYRLRCCLEDEDGTDGPNKLNRAVEEEVEGVSVGSIGSAQER
jgi:hypothetical protein